jgi:hypothetical protein
MLARMLAVWLDAVLPLRHNQFSVAQEGGA